MAGRAGPFLGTPRGYAELERFGGPGRLDSRFLLAHNVC